MPAAGLPGKGDGSRGAEAALDRVGVHPDSEVRDLAGAIERDGGSSYKQRTITCLAADDE